MKGATTRFFSLMAGSSDSGISILKGLRGFSRSRGSKGFCRSRGFRRFSRSKG